MQAFYSDNFVLPLPPGHRFPMAKYQLLRDALAAQLPQVQFVQAPAAIDAELAFAHHPAYIGAIANGSVDAKILRDIGFPWSPAMAERARRSVGGTLQAARTALAQGMRLNIASGSAVRFEPGQERTVELVDYAGDRTVYGFRGLTQGKL